jgi:hypothetical protein
MTNLRQLHELVLEHLDRGEHILHSVFGCYETTSMGRKAIRNGAFFATNMRLIFYGKRIFGFDIEIFPYEKISSIEFGKGLTGHRIRFVTSGNDVRMTMINVGDIDAFTQYMRSAINGKSLPVLAIQGVSAQAMNLEHPSEQDLRPKANLPSVENTLSVGLSSIQTLGAAKQPVERTVRDLIICGVTGFITGFGVGAPLSIGAYLMWRRIGIKGGLRWTAWAATGFFTVPIIAASFNQIGEKQTNSVVSKPSQVISPAKQQTNKPLPVIQAQERTPAQNLALIDSSNGFGSTQQGSDTIYDTLLDKVSPKCNESKSKVADMTVVTLDEYRKIDKQGSNLSLLRELATVQEGYEGTQDCAGLYTALIVLKQSGYR